MSGDGSGGGPPSSRNSRKRPDISRPLPPFTMRETSTPGDFGASGACADTAKFLQDNTSHESGISLGISQGSGSSRSSREADFGTTEAAGGRRGVYPEDPRGIYPEDLRSYTGRTYIETHFPVEPSQVNNQPPTDLYCYMCSLGSYMIL